MTPDPAAAIDLLNRRFFLDYPLDAARTIEQLNTTEVVEAVSRLPAKILEPVWRRLLPDVAATVMRKLPDDLADGLLSELPPPNAVRILRSLPETERKQRLLRLERVIREDLEELSSYPSSTAGSLMDSSVCAHRQDATAGDTLQSLRRKGMRTARSLFLVDDDLRLVGKVALTDIALAPPGTTLAALQVPIVASVRPVDPVEDVAEAFETKKLLDLPVVDLDGIFLGAITHEALAKTIQEDVTSDMQSMVGASRDERALSSPLFTVRKRMPWLQINLLTAFLAASVVGVFQNTIAQVTALAVLLPVVAGQSGNAGAQALAVTMRGLALREITARQWARVMRKEVMAGLLNGVAIAATCGLGTYVWSQSLGLVAVIALSMILAMIAAGFAGAVIPMALARMGQDPATSSSIILTTVTDIAGFFSFLGIATLLIKFL